MAARLAILQQLAQLAQPAPDDEKLLVYVSAREKLLANIATWEGLSAEETQLVQKITRQGQDACVTAEDCRHAVLAALESVARAREVATSPSSHDTGSLLNRRG